MSNSFDRQSVLTTLGHAYTHGMKLSELAAALDIPKAHHPRLRKLLTTLIDEDVVYELARASAHRVGKAAGLV